MLQSIWFILWGVLWAVYFMLDGFDLGLGTLLPFLAKDETEKRIIYNAAGPFWDANEVWLIAAGGVTFAAFPTTYAAMFSGLYSALMLILFALIIRGISFEFRRELDHPTWKKVWEVGTVIGSFLPALLLGVAFANLFEGIPIDESGQYTGTLFTLLNPYGILGGLLFLSLFTVHGCLWLAAKTEEGSALHERAVLFAKRLWVVELAVAVIFLAATWFATNLYANYYANPLLYSVPLVLIPLATVGALLMIRQFLAKGLVWKAWFSSSVTIVGATLFGVVGLYPNLIPSSTNPAFSLTIYNSSSSQLTLQIMLTVAAIFVPIVIAYQAWVYNFFKAKITKEDLLYDEAH